MRANADRGLTSDDGAERSVQGGHKRAASAHPPLNAAGMDEALDARQISPAGIERESEIGRRTAIAAPKIAPNFSAADGSLRAQVKVGRASPSTVQCCDVGQPSVRKSLCTSVRHLSRQRCPT